MTVTWLPHKSQPWTTDTYTICRYSARVLRCVLSAINTQWVGCSYSLPGCVLAFAAQLRSFFADFGGHLVLAVSRALLYFGQVFRG
jgi:hypothetical protein